MKDILNTGKSVKIVKYLKEVGINIGSLYRNYTNKLEEQIMNTDTNTFE